MDKYFDIEENIDNMYEKTTEIKRKIMKPRKKTLTKIGKLAFFGPPIAALLSGVIKFQGDYMMSKAEETYNVDATFEYANTAVHTEILPVNILTDKGIMSYNFNVDALITNFHLPKSTLVMLVSALAGRENILNAYNIAVQEKYRFFSFGDAMFIK